MGSRLPTWWPSWSAVKAPAGSKKSIAQSQRPGGAGRKNRVNDDIVEVPRGRPSDAGWPPGLGLGQLHPPSARGHGACIPGAQISVLVLVVALVIDLVKRSDARGTWHESHFSWRLRSVIWAGVLYVVTFPFFLLGLFLFNPAWVLISIWFPLPHRARHDRHEQVRAFATVTGNARQLRPQRLKACL